MNQPFEIAMPARILFGRGKAAESIPLLASFGRRVLIVHGSNAARIAWLTDELESACETVTTAACAGEPDLALVEQTVLTARQAKIDAVIAIGGGSVIDLGKAVAGLARVNGAVLDYLEVVGAGKPLDAEPLPFAALPTTSGTGAEATKNAVIGVPSHQRKVSLRDNRMLADLVIADPALTDGCPRGVTLASGLDAITQLIEPYLSVKANAFTDGLCLNALPGALGAIQVLMEREDETARDVMSWASLSSGIALANSGLGAVHGLAGVIGGMTGAAHGEICASLLAASLQTNRDKAKTDGRDTSRIDAINEMIGTAFADQPDDDGFAKLAGWILANGIKPIDQLGLARDGFAAAAQQSLSSSSMRGNMQPLTEEELVSILEKSASSVV